jgi:hypothetical protein
VLTICTRLQEWPTKWDVSDHFLLFFFNLLNLKNSLEIKFEFYIIPILSSILYNKGGTVVKWWRSQDRYPDIIKISLSLLSTYCMVLPLCLQLVPSEFFLNKTESKKTICKISWKIVYHWGTSRLSLLMISHALLIFCFMCKFMLFSPPLFQHRESIVDLNKQLNNLHCIIYIIRRRLRKCSKRVCLCFEYVLHSVIITTIMEVIWKVISDRSIIVDKCLDCITRYLKKSAHSSLS